MDGDAVFAHPVERELARLYDAHGIAWQYEPHTFVLERNEDGSVREAFTPDFYLPDLDVYLECTVMRQPLTRRKRRKVRKVREVRGVPVEILYRRDFARLARRWNLEQLGRAATPIARFDAPQNGESAPATMGDAATNPEASHEFRIDGESPRPGLAVLVVSGDADLHSAPELRERIRDAIDDGSTQLVLDLSDTTFVDSTSLGVLLGGMKKLREQNGEIRLVVPRAEVRRVFEITLLDRVFPLHDTREDALAHAADGAS